MERDLSLKIVSSWYGRGYSHIKELTQYKLKVKSRKDCSKQPLLWNKNK